MNSTKARARQAGVLYLLLAMTGSVNDIYVPRAFVVPGDATATARNITSAELTYRIGILAGLVSHILFLLLVSSLYHLLKYADRKQARLMVIVGCFAYLAVSCTALVLPAHRHVVSQIMLPFFAIGELSMIVWLLVKGAKVPLSETRPSHVST
jgi:hypothetical protein